MKDLGYSRPLYICLSIIGVRSRRNYPAGPEVNGTQIAASKQVICDRFKAALRDEVLDFRAGILVDEKSVGRRIWRERRYDRGNEEPASKRGFSESITLKKEDSKSCKLE
jgi:hypothetical protein